MYPLFAIIRAYNQNFAVFVANTQHFEIGSNNFKVLFPTLLKTQKNV